MDFRFVPGPKTLDNRSRGQHPNCFAVVPRNAVGVLFRRPEQEGIAPYQVRLAIDFDEASVG